MGWSTGPAVVSERDRRGTDVRSGALAFRFWLQKGKLRFRNMSRTSLWAIICFERVIVGNLMHYQSHMSVFLMKRRELCRSVVNKRSSVQRHDPRSYPHNSQLLAYKDKHTDGTHHVSLLSSFDAKATKQL